MESKKIRVIYLLGICLLFSCQKKDAKLDISNKENETSNIEGINDSDSVLTKRDTIFKNTVKPIQKKITENIDEHIENWFNLNLYTILSSRTVPPKTSKLWRAISQRSTFNSPKTIYIIRAKKTEPIEKEGANYFPVLVTEKWEFDNETNAMKVYNYLDQMEPRPFLQKPPTAFLVDQQHIYILTSTAELYRNEVRKLHNSFF